METVETILARARQRATDGKLPYAGALLPAEAFALWKQGAGAVLVDVRTQAEWDYVGRVPDAVEVQWNLYPSGRNPRFGEELAAALPDRSVPVLFLCRSGGRSGAAAAAATQMGFTQAFNILEGFEGDLDAAGHRNRVGGWRHAGLPWKQS